MFSGVVIMEPQKTTTPKGCGTTKGKRKAIEKARGPNGDTWLYKLVSPWRKDL